jgi:hypothetical protein
MQCVCNIINITMYVNICEILHMLNEIMHMLNEYLRNKISIWNNLFHFWFVFINIDYYCL